MFNIFNSHKNNLLPLKKGEKRFIFALVILYLSGFIVPALLNSSSFLLIYIIIYYVGGFILSEITIHKTRIICLKNILECIKPYTLFIIVEIILLVIISTIFTFLSYSLLEQKSLNEDSIQHLPIFIHFILGFIICPIIEESIFRYSLRQLIKNNDLLFIMVSGLTFGFQHTITSIGIFNSAEFAVCSTPYIIVGLYLSYIFVKTQNSIEITILSHRILNLIPFISIIFSYIKQPF